MENGIDIGMIIIIDRSGVVGSCSRFDVRPELQGWANIVAKGCGGDRYEGGCRVDRQLVVL